MALNQSIESDQTVVQLGRCLPTIEPIKGAIELDTIASPPLETQRQIASKDSKIGKIQSLKDQVSYIERVLGLLESQPHQSRDELERVQH